MRAYLFLTALLLSIGFSFPTSLSAQNNPVKWTFEIESIGKQEYEVVATASIQSGWSVYSKDMKPGGPIPTKVVIENNPNIQIVGEVVEVGQMKREYDENFEMELIKLSGRPQFRQRIKVSNGQDEINGSINYMTCNSSSCLPPTDVNFSLPLD